MEIPFYTSFKEFKDNYETDLEKWLSIYPDGDEMDYLGCVYERYSDYAVTGIDEPYYKDETFWVEVKPNKVPKYYWNLQGQYCVDEDNNVFESLSFIQIFEVINKRCGNTDFPDGISFVNKQVNGYSKMDLLQHISDCIVDTEKRYSPNGINDNYIIPYDLDILFEDYIELIEIKTPMGLTINKTKYNNFKLSVPKIYKFISDRRKEINGVQTTDEVTPTAEEQHTTGEEHEKQKARVKLNKTQKINILIELGIYQHIYNKGYHGRQVEFLFADILDTTDRYVREVRTSSGKINQEFAKDYLEKLKNMKTEDLEKKSKNQ
ncbi:hypothetical protein [Riemerella anatipestifer]|uniref:hypothetical protein n=1 Tax=Riemerella anatipestifer TaxID=34085 RepID=UPI00162A8DD0|nr:hypothetical protein [Riemerella anatipestifer]MBT0550050.1 hypothetical protein [Riemerella anatipestifer]MBT0556888.1 hypothetical protein [Riemerella anatipestifer]MBT0560791.1 hypothetical protein [Riemerella anatipestifer]NAV17149.1 hypothetical protein [Riemerella anatipestifer]UZX27630.1 hypothetical protein OIS45_09720 [Riemerella anatipestifer]